MYHPEQRLVSGLAHISRKAILPEEAVGSVQVRVGQQVDVNDVVARGLVPARHVIIEAAQELHLKEKSDLRELLLVSLNTLVEKGTIIAGRNANRGRRVYAPVSGLITYVEQGRIIMQEVPRRINLTAGVRGRVRHVYDGRGVTIEAVGAVIQGVWGNNRITIGPLRLEPENGGIESIKPEALDTNYKGEVLVTRRQLTEKGIKVARVRGFAGIIAPSMDASMIDDVLSLSFPVMLTAGFGHANMTHPVWSLLESFDTYQVALDAARPSRFEVRRPEAIITLPGNQTPEAAEDTGLKVGSRVRLTRAPHFGLVGTVSGLPKQLLQLENGLRVRGALVQMISGEIIEVPLANLELAGT